MNGVSITFDPQVTSYAQARKLQLSREELAHLGATLNLICTVDDANQVAFDLGGGRTGSINDALDVFAIGMGKPVSSSTPKPSIPAGGNKTEQAVATNAANRANANAAKRQQAQELVQKFGNPWRTKNRTHQAFVTNTAPDLVGKLKSEAGVRA